jgi:agmatinase
MRRTNEEVRPAKIIEVGTRAVCKEELKYAKEANIDFFTTQYVRKEGSALVAKLLKEKLENCKNVYVSVDMDILDPAFVPAVQNPEGDGLEMHHLLDLLGPICDQRVVGFDVLEIAPDYDRGVSAVQAAKVIFEMLCSIEKSRKSRHQT